jgi:hypothetical protein
MSTPYGVNADAGNSGALRITYGRAGLTREIICDARSCRLYLGECDTAVVEAWRWTSFNDAVDVPTANIAADICLASGGAYDDASVTYLKNYLDTDEIDLTLPVPRHARWYTPIVQWTSSPWGGTLCDINYYGTGIAPFLFSASNYLWLPPIPRLEVIQSPLRIVSSGAIDQDLTVGARFWIST